MASRRGFSPIIGGVNGHPANQGMGRSYGRPSVFDAHGYEYSGTINSAITSVGYQWTSMLSRFTIKTSKVESQKAPAVSLELAIRVSCQSLLTRALKSSSIIFRLNG